MSSRAHNWQTRHCGVEKARGITYLCNPSNVLVAILLRKPEVLVQSEAYIVAIKTVCCESEVKQVLLQSCCNGGFAGCGETCEPDREAALLAVCVALAAGQGRVPGDVTTAR